MFVQVISGKVADAEAMQRVADRWERDLRPGAVGYLGTTIGVTDDNRFVVIARFESSEAAKRNSDRPEQGEWWSEMEQHTSDVVVHDCSRVETLFGGGKDDAGFVQVMQGHIADAGKADAMFARAGDAERVLGAARPDVIGEVVAIHDDRDGYTDVVYFSSEAEARANEKRELPSEAQAMMQEFGEALVVDEFFDLAHPILR